jgi:hypothetical protein
MLAWFEYCLDLAATGVSRLTAASASAAALDRSPAQEKEVIYIGETSLIKHDDQIDLTEKQQLTH